MIINLAYHAKKKNCNVMPVFHAKMNPDFNPMPCFLPNIITGCSYRI